MTIMHCYRSNPVRAVDWRWQRAQGAYNREQPLPGRRRDGSDGFGWIKRAMRFINAHISAGDDASQMALEELDPDVFWAHYVHSLKDEWVRNSLQASLLTRDDDWEIGYRLGYSPGVVKAYEALFFNVREKLDHPLYIANVIFRDHLQMQLTPRDYGIVWKLYAYMYGSHVLQAVMTSTVNPVTCGNVDTVGSCLQDDAIATMKLKAALAAKMTSVTSDTALLLLEQFAKFVEIERTTESEGRSQSQLMDNIAATLSGLPFGVDGTLVKLDKPLPRGPLAQFDTGAAELTYQETLRVAAGDKLAYADQIKTMKIHVKPDTEPGK